MSLKESSLQSICLSTWLEDYNHEAKGTIMKTTLVDDDEGSQQHNNPK